MSRHQYSGLLADLQPAPYARRGWADLLRSLPVPTSAEASDARIQSGSMFRADVSRAEGRSDGLPSREATERADAHRANEGLSPTHKSPLCPDGPSSLSYRAYRSAADSRIQSLCGVRYAINGNIVKLFVPTTESKAAGPDAVGRDAARGDIGEFSRESRRRFMNLLNSIDRQKLPVENVFFTTLTYHMGWPDTFDGWKRHLETLWKRFQREYLEEYGVEVNAVTFAAASLIWKLEYQRRGAPHFHCLILWIGKAPPVAQFREWLALNWAEVVAGRGNPVDAEHLKAGTQCDLAQKWGGVSSYAAKYCGKQTHQLIDKDTGEIHKNGRWWGVKHVRALPISFESERLTEEQSVTLRRVLQKKSIREAVTAATPDRNCIKWRKKRRGLKMSDEVFYVTDTYLKKLVAWVRQEKPQYRE